MKKLASFIMVLTMLASMLAIAVSAEQTNMEVFAPKFATQPSIDGVVTVQEWGAVTTRLVTDGAATVDDVEVGYNEALGLKNYFFWTVDETIYDSMAYDLWLRWDDQYLYVAAIVDDPDPLSSPATKTAIGDGDSFEIKLDLAGPSAMMLKKDADFNYKTDAFLGARYKEPWSSKSELFAVILGLANYQLPTIWRNAEPYTLNGVEISNDLSENGALVGVSYVPHDNDTCTITYECAIPWNLIKEGHVPAAGDAYGMGIAAKSTDNFGRNAWLQWGQAVMDPDAEPKGTRGGSQAMVLSADTVTPEEGYEIATTGGTVETEDDSIGDIPAPPVVTDADNGDETAGTAAGTKAPANTTADATGSGDSEGLPTAAIIAIVVAAVVVVAVVVVVIVKKKK